MFKHDQGAERGEETGHALQSPRPASSESSTPEQDPKKTNAKFSTATRSTGISF